MDLYALSKDMNLVNICQPLFNSGWYLDTDGKIKTPSKIATNIPWVFVEQEDARKCNLWHGIFFNVFGWLPSACLECWKVVVRPQTVSDLFELHEIQMDMGLFSKCGIEVRESVCGLYGGYFYNDSLDQGYTVQAEVKKEVTKRLEHEAPVILKRGCTEFEHKYGDSYYWESHVSDKQIYMERRLDRFIETHEKTAQPQVVKESIYKRWIEFAHASGDISYKKFTDGKPLYTPYRTYNDVKKDYGADDTDLQRYAWSEHEAASVSVD